MTQPTPEGFADRVRREAEAEATAVLEDLKRLRFRADQVIHVMRALKLRVPREIEALESLWSTTDREPPQPATPATPPVAPDDAIGEGDAVPGVPSSTSGVAHPGNIEARVLEVIESKPGYRWTIDEVHRRFNEHAKTVSREEVRAACKGLLESDRVEQTINNEDKAAYRTIGSGKAQPAPTMTTPKAQPAPPPPKRVATPKPAKPKPSGKSGKNVYVRQANPNDFPEDLRAYPAANSGGPLANITDTVKSQKATHEFLRDNGPATVATIAKALGTATANVSRWLHSLGEVGMVALTGQQEAGAPVFKVGDGTPIPKEWPPALKDMPVANGERVNASTLTIAMQQRYVMERAQEHDGTFVIAEFEKLIPEFPRSRINEYLNALAEQGRFVRRTGGFRRAKGQAAGRTAVEFEAIRDPSQSASGPASQAKSGSSPSMDEPSVPPTAASARGERIDATKESGGSSVEPKQQDILNGLRDAMRSFDGEEFTASQIKMAMRGETPIKTVTTLLETLASSGSVMASGTGASRRYRYDRPRSAGSAATMDASRRKTPSATSNGDPAVAGTGRGQRAGNKEVQAILDAVRQKGGTFKAAANGHWVVKGPKGEVQIPGTPSNPRSLLSAKARIRRDTGLAV